MPCTKLFFSQEAYNEKALCIREGNTLVCAFTDAWDNKTYRCTNIGTQTWMAQNLNYNASGSRRYNNNDANCTTYGRMYNWVQAMDHQGACPVGWHVPTQAEYIPGGSVKKKVQEYKGLPIINL